MVLDWKTNSKLQVILCTCGVVDDPYILVRYQLISFQSDKWQDWSTSHFICLFGIEGWSFDRHDSHAPMLMVATERTSVRQLVGGRWINCQSKSNWFLSYRINLRCGNGVGRTCGARGIPDFEGVENYKSHIWHHPHKDSIPWPSLKSCMKLDAASLATMSEA